MRRLLAPALFASALLWLLPLPAAAQTDERDRLTAFLEDNLSSAGRTVVVTGFRGAFSSRAEMDTLTIADAQGVWLTLNGLVLDWNRLALLQGRVEVAELLAQEVIVARAPVSGEDATPAPEASGFALPDLPVSVSIGKLVAERLELGASLLGQPVVATLEASAQLANGEGQANLDLTRIGDGPEGKITLEASYGNISRNLVVNLSAVEGAGGIAAGLMGLPGTPSVTLTIKGAGPLENFAADVLLETDDAPRLTGTVQLQGVEQGAHRFAADLGGDLAPLFLPEYAEFFGPEVRLRLEGQRSPLGRLDLSALAVETRALTLEGAALIAADGLPERFSLVGRLGLADGSPVLLPLAGEGETRIASADLRLNFDAANGDGWSGAVALTGLDRADLTLKRAELTASGRINRRGDAPVMGGTLEFTATDAVPTDAGIAAALGRNLTGGATFDWQPGGTGLRIGRLALTGDDYGVKISGRVGDLASGFRVNGLLEAEYADLSRLSLLAGRPLAGRAVLTAAGDGSPLGGDFDGTATITGTDIQTGQPELDRVLRGQSVIELSAKRDASGMVLRGLDLTAQQLVAKASGNLASTGSDLTADLTFADLSVLGPGYGGTLRTEARFQGTLAEGRLELTGTAQDVAVGQPQANRLLAGASTLTAVVNLRDGRLEVESARLANPALTATATGSVTRALRQVRFDARLANLALLIPEFAGPLTLTGTAQENGDGFVLDLAGRGPGGIDARIAGRLAPGLRSADLAINGTAQAALANVFLGSRSLSGQTRFDLRLNGPLALSSLSGQASLSGGRFADPALPFSLQNITGTASLSGASARIETTAGATSGGTIAVSGDIGLTAPFNADLAITLTALQLKNPELFETSVSGPLTLRGPLRGGALLAGVLGLGDTELRVPSTGLGGTGSIPDLRHVNEPADVRATRGRAGLLGGASARGAAGGGALALDLTINAPSRIFLRGRGLDAELGGSVTLRGTTAAVVPIGGFDLIRGRLDILGKRLELTSARLLLQGDLVPYIEIIASNDSDGITTSVVIEGPADAPDVRFTSNPQLPQEEVLARLLFGRGLETISALQALQLANAVATLAGRGGEGIVGRLRQGFGLDDLDFQTDADGNASLKAGKYISRNVYTEVEVDQQGRSKINLNLDIKPGVKLRGSVGGAGNAGIGVFVEKDY